MYKRQLKGAAGNLGAEGIRQLARTIEQSVATPADQPAETCVAAIRQLAHAFTDLAAAIGVTFPEHPAGMAAHPAIDESKAGATNENRHPNHASDGENSVPYAGSTAGHEPPPPTNHHPLAARLERLLESSDMAANDLLSSEEPLFMQVFGSQAEELARLINQYDYPEALASLRNPPPVPPGTPSNLRKESQP